MRVEYAESNNAGRRVGGARMHQAFDSKLRKVRIRMEAGAWRPGISDGARRIGRDTGVSCGNRAPMWAYVETSHAHQNTTEKGLSGVGLGAVMPEWL